MSQSKQSSKINTRWQAQFYTDLLSGNKPIRGMCEIENETLSIRSGRNSGKIPFKNILDVKITNPPSWLQDYFEKSFCIKFNISEGNNGTLFIEYCPNKENIFAYELFSNIITGSHSICNFIARKGGKQTQQTAKKAKLTINEKNVVLQSQNKQMKIWLGDVVDINRERRRIGNYDIKKKVISIKHIKDKKQHTTRVFVINKQERNLFNRYMRKKYRSIRSELEDISPSKDEIELVIGYYTTQDITQTEQALTGGRKSKFESIYENAMKHGLVTDPDKQIQLTQKGRMLANMKLETVNQ